jgi:hypothetical protein
VAPPFAFQSQVRLVWPVWVQIIFAVLSSRSTDLDCQVSVPKLAVPGRYNQSLCLWVSSCSLQGIAERPLPCFYHVIQFDIALSSVVARSERGGWSCGTRCSGLM